MLYIRKNNNFKIYLKQININSNLKVSLYLFYLVMNMPQNNLLFKDSFLIFKILTHIILNHHFRLLLSLIVILLY